MSAPSKSLLTRIRQAAKAYRRAGFNVIPLRNYEKSPASYNSVMPKYWERKGRIVEVEPDDPSGWVEKQGWKPLQGRMASNTEFERMFGGNDITGVGVITGQVSDLYVLDEDSYKEGGQKVGRTSPLASHTANGGRHYFFSFDPSVASKGLQNQVFIEGKGEGGFVVLPPSMVIKKDGTSKGDYRWLEEVKIKERPKITKSDIVFLPEEELNRLQPDGTLDISDLLRVKEGGRHNAMRSLMLKKLNVTKPELWERDLLPEIKAHNQGYQPPLGDAEMAKLWRDTRQKFMDSPPEWFKRYQERQEGNKAEQVPDTIDKPQKLTSVVEERLRERELEKDAASTGYRELDALIKGFIPGHLYTLTGETNIGKTAMCANFAINVAKQGKEVLYIALEPDNMIVEYIASVHFKKKYDDITPEDLVEAAEQDGHINVYGQQTIPTAEHLLKAIEEENQYQLIIVDHVGYFVKDKANTYQDQSNVIKQLAVLAKKKKVPIVLVAHINKEASKRKKALTYNDISGSAAFKQDRTDVWMLVRGNINTDKDQGHHLYSEKGFVVVAKSKSGGNGAIEVCFRKDKALVQEPGEQDDKDIEEMF